ncbi:MarR family winged helix-turn-helix transcriptional regulator [Streptomyces radicis]|uniref:MarR family transcriptional regulator n=1 Tax=Streptomyces radicis TaxID=1750517 RepID=A0A3A9W113_9ACTN|nr:MarR family winged helix-turn-helix transcriptional regulator [Streptomyces radicis]RKN06452.1 MarR family transcriptional regulator [Streptomyces radicis]RKN20289.1 MarR family transcriptional regulator [Streptomyces radicis]
MEDAHARDIAAIEAAVVALRRTYKRRAPARLAARRGERPVRHGQLPDAVFELLDAIESSAARGETLTVSEAAAVLGVDQPRSSRLTAQALAAGLLRREADHHDGRRSLLALTPEGHDVLLRIRGFRRRVIAEATADWPDTDRATLARLLTRFVRDVDPG